MGLAKGIGKFLLNPVLGTMNGVLGGTFHAAQGVMSGAWKGISGAELKLTNKGLFDKLTNTLGYGVGKTLNVTVGKPAVSAAWYLTKNTPKDFIKWSNRFGKLGTGVRDTFLKKATDEEIAAGEHLFGYKARALTPLALTAGAIGIGVAEGAGDYNYNLGLQTAVNGVMDTEGVEVVPGSINPTYTPVTPKGRHVNNHGATGELPLALHKQRTSGYL